MIERYGVIIGAMKAATTTLFDVMATHPAVAPSTPKEPKYFAIDDRFEKGADWYQSRWDFDPSVHEVALEASTHYSMRDAYPETVKRIAGHGGTFRFVYVVRDPIARIESHYQHALARGWPVSELPIDDALDNEPLIATSRYAHQLDAYRDQFGADAVTVVQFEDVTGDVSAVARKVCEHWSLDPGGLGTVLARQSNRTADKVVSKRVNALRRVPGAVRLAQSLDSSFVRRVKGLVAAGEEPPVEMSSATRAAVLAELDTDMARLESEWGVDVRSWRRPDLVT